MLPVLWTKFTFLKRSRSFQRGTVSLNRSKGCKVMIHQTLRMIPSSGTLSRATIVWCLVGRAADFFSDFQIWQLIILQTSDLQRPTVPVWRALSPFKTYFWFISLAAHLRLVWLSPSNPISIVVIYYRYFPFFLRLYKYKKHRASGVIKMKFKNLSHSM